jgi:hypothetical protein
VTQAELYPAEMARREVEICALSAPCPTVLYSNHGKSTVSYVLKFLTMKVTVVKDIVPCGLIEIDRRFGSGSCLYLEVIE